MEGFIKIELKIISQHCRDVRHHFSFCTLEAVLLEELRRALGKTLSSVAISYVLVNLKKKKNTEELNRLTKFQFSYK